MRSRRRGIRTIAAAAALIVAPVACGDSGSPFDCSRFKPQNREHIEGDSIRVHKGPVFLNGPFSDSDPTLKLRRSPAVPPQDTNNHPPCDNIALELRPGQSITVDNAEVVDGRDNPADWLTFEVKIGGKPVDVYVSTGVGTEGYIDGFSPSKIARFDVETVDERGSVTAARERVGSVRVGSVQERR